MHGRESLRICIQKNLETYKIMKILLEEIRDIPRLKESEFTAFENLSFKVNNFRDKLIEMGLQEEVENKYVLNEIEDKLCKDDLHKWLDSLGDEIDSRRVEKLVTWLDKQTRLRRIVHGTSPSVSTSSRLTGSRKNMFESSVTGKLKKE